MARFRFDAPLNVLFPPNDPRSSWMLRLAIIRDDAAHEFSKLFLKEEDGTAKVWRSAYAIRRMSVIIDEATSVFRQEVMKYLKDMKGTAFHRLTEDFTKRLEVARKILKPLRDAFGGHVRAENAVDGEQKPTLMPRVLARLGDMPVSVTIDADKPARGEMHMATNEYFIFLWPHIADAEPGDDAIGEDEVKRRIRERYRQEHMKIRDELFACMPGIVTAADAMLYYFWQELDVPVRELGAENKAYRTRRGQFPLRD